MAQRLAVLLAVASILVVVCAAEYREATASKYERKPHGKHTEKYDKPEHKEYKPEHREYMPEPKEYKLDGYKPAYPGKEYEHYGEPSYGGGYEYDGYGHDSYNSYDYTPPLNSKQYDSGYFGGQNGRHIIHLTSALQEALLNASTITGVKGNNTGTFCRPINGVPTGCDRDFGLLCGLKSANSYGYNSDYSSAHKGYPLLPKTPAPPVPIGEGYITGSIDINLDELDDDDIDKLLILDQHRVAYRVGFVNGYMAFNDGADDCYPLLGSGTVVQFGTDTDTSETPDAVPVYAMLTKTKAPADPAWVWRLWDALDNAGNPGDPGGKAMMQSADVEYKTASDGSKYIAGPGYTYLPQEDGSFCGLTLVIKGPASMSVTTSSTNARFTGVIEAAVLFWDGVMRLPGISDVQGDNNDLIRTFGKSEAAVFYGLTVQRLQAMCKSSSIPFADIGTWTLDMTQVS